MQSALLSQLSLIRGASFANFLYTNKVGGRVLTPETAKHQLVLGASTEELYRKDVDILSVLVDKAGLSPVYQTAARELLDSRIASLTLGVGNNPEYTQADTYIHFTGLRGVKMHKETGELYVAGLSISKTVLTPGTYKEVKSSEKTLAKNGISLTLPSGKYRQYKLERIQRAALNGNVLELV